MKKYGKIFEVMISFMLILALSGLPLKLSAAAVGTLPPENLVSPPNSQTDTSILLLWDTPGNMNNAEFEKYIVYCNGKEMGETAKMGYTASGLAPGSSFTFTVKAKDTSGRLSADSNPITVSTKPAGKVLDVTQSPYNASGDGAALNTASIQKAIDDLPPGGTVYIPKGTFKSGALFLKSNMTLKIDGTLLGSTNPDDYPAVACRFEGQEMDCYSSLLTLGSLDKNGPYNITNVVICGSGTIDGSGRDLGAAQKAKALPTNRSGNRSRGRGIITMNAQNIYIKDLTVSYGPAWTTHLIYSDNITYDNVRLISMNPEYKIGNGDGVDIDSSTHINIFNSYFHTGDDAICMKSGKNLEGYTINKPSEYIRITDCTVDGSSWGGIVVGSEMSGSVRHVLAQNCTLKNVSDGLYVKCSEVRGGIVEDLKFRDITINGAKVAIKLTTAYDGNNDGKPAPVPPIIKDISFQNIKATGISSSSSDLQYKCSINITGLSNSLIKNIYFKDVDITGTYGARINYADGITIDNVKINNRMGQPWNTTNAANVTEVPAVPSAAVKNGNDDVNAVADKQLQTSGKDSSGPVKFILAALAVLILVSVLVFAYKFFTGRRTVNR